MLLLAVSAVFGRIDRRGFDAWLLRLDVMGKWCIVYVRSTHGVQGNRLDVALLLF